MERNLRSHKGENGKVAVIGGSATIHGAPIFSAMAAEASGADLIYVTVPARHAEIARAASLNFQVHPLRGDDLSHDDLGTILELLATMDAAVIGPGLSRTKENLSVLESLIASVTCPMVLDASALQPWTVRAARGKKAVLTPHLGELERMGVKQKDLKRAAKELFGIIHLKGATDTIALPSGAMKEVMGGNAGLTVGGTGDALAGLIAGLIAQGMPHAEACVTASTVIKRAGTMLFSDYGYAYGTRRVIEAIPRLLHCLTRE